MKSEKWIAVSITVLSIAILISGFWIGSSIAALQPTPTRPDNPDIMSPAEAAVFLKITEGKLNELVENSKYMDGVGIPYYKVDEKIQFSRTALAEWVVHIANEHHTY